MHMYGYFIGMYMKCIRRILVSLQLIKLKFRNENENFFKNWKIL